MLPSRAICKHGGDVTEKDRADAVNALLEGILAAFHATQHENNDPFTDCQTFAEAALASLESSGFVVVRKT